MVDRDLGFPDDAAEDLQLKARMTSLIYGDIIRQRLSLQQVADLLHLSNKDAELLCRCRHMAFSVEQLRLFLRILLANYHSYAESPENPRNLRQKGGLEPSDTTL
jgi:predicted XRE-type DNA-binding protein